MHQRSALTPLQANKLLHYFYSKDSSLRDELELGIIPLEDDLEEIEDRLPPGAEITFTPDGLQMSLKEFIDDIQGLGITITQLANSGLLSTKDDTDKYVSLSGKEVHRPWKESCGDEERSGGIYEDQLDAGKIRENNELFMSAVENDAVYIDMYTLTEIASKMRRGGRGEV